MTRLRSPAARLLRADPNAQSLLTELQALYRRAEQMLDGWSCPSCTHCCRFGITGREPYVTSIELLAVQRAIAARGGLLSDARRAEALARNERTCPLLDRAGRCSIYASRPIGCRTFYCEQASPGADLRSVTRELVRSVQMIAVRHQPGGDQARPLGRFFGV